MIVAADVPPLVDVVLKVTVLLGTAALLARALSRRSAAARHQVWAVAIAASLMMPVIALVAPQWTIAVLPSPAVIADTAPASALASAPVVADGVGSGVRATAGDDTKRERASQHPHRRARARSRRRSRSG